MAKIIVETSDVQAALAVFLKEHYSIDVAAEDLQIEVTDITISLTPSGAKVESTEATPKPKTTRTRKPAIKEEAEDLAPAVSEAEAKRAKDIDAEVERQLAGDVPEETDEPVNTDPVSDSVTSTVLDEVMGSEESSESTKSIFDL